MRVAILLACLLPCTASATSIDVLTMGEGDDLFSHFGHAAICVNGDGAPRCYNYGTADFTTPGPLTWDFVRGRARFWVSVQDEPGMVAAYRRADRTVWRQRLPLDEAQARALAGRLEAGTAPDVRTYRYHHFDDNCSTRVRDAVEVTLPGTLQRGTAGQRTFRELARRGLRSNLALLTGAELLLGRRTDRVPTPWEVTFLPAELRARLQAQLGAEPQVVSERRAAVPDGDPAAGQRLLAITGLVLGLLTYLVSRRSMRLAAMALLLPGLVAILPWALAIASPLPELRWNEVLLVLWPTDVAVPWLSATARRRYLAVRLAALGLVLLARVGGVLVQPLAAPLLLVLPAMLATWAAQRRYGVVGRRAGSLAAR